MGGYNGVWNGTCRPAWVERDREWRKGGASASGVNIRERRAKRLRWLGMRISTGGSTWGRVPIQFGIYNIRNAKNGGLGLALWGLLQAYLDLQQATFPDS